VDPPPPGQHRPGHRPHLRRPRHRRTRRRLCHPDLGRRAWPGKFGSAGPHRWGWLALLPSPHRPGQRPARRLGAGGLAGPGWLCGRPTQPPRLRTGLPVVSRPRPGHPTRSGARGNAGAAPVPPTQTTNQSGPAPSRPRWLRRPLRAGSAGRGASPGRHRPQGGSATASCGSRPATSTTWSPPAPLTTARSIEDCWRPPSVVGCSARSRARPTAPWPPAARSASPTPATHPRNAPRPRRSRPLGRSARPPRRGGDGHGRRRPPGRLTPVRGVGACRHQAEPAPTPTTPQEGVPGWAATPP
jgi:hypothetical protein